MNLNNKIALVTGAGRSIGSAIASKLAEYGATVIVADISFENAQSTAEGISDTGLKAIGISLDVTNQESAENVCEEILRRFGRIDILVNNAGVVAAPGWEDRKRPNDSDWEFTYSVNARGMARMSDIVAESMKQQKGGKIVNISSVAGRASGSTTSIAYSASKAAAISITQTMSQELADSNINVNVICPGLIWTEMWARIAVHYGNIPERAKGLKDPREIFNRTVKERIPLGREQTSADVANAVLFFASDLSKNITGQALNVTGGWTMN